MKPEVFISVHDGPPPELPTPVLVQCVADFEQRFGRNDPRFNAVCELFMHGCVYIALPDHVEKVRPR